MAKILSVMERLLPENIMLKIKLLRMVCLYPYHFSTYAATAFSDPLSDAEIAALKAGLDDESCAVVDQYLGIRKLTEYDVFQYFPMVDLRFVISPKQNDLILQQKRMRECLKKMPVLRGCRTEILQETSLVHGLVTASPEELTYIRGRDFIDAGAYCGESSVLMSEFMPRRIEAFEPVPAYREKMAEMLAEAGLHIPVSIHPEALGAVSGEQEFWLDDQGSSLAETGRARTGDGAIQVQVSRLDDLVSAWPDADIGFIKADVEGAGRSMLSGMLETVRKFRPILSLAIYHSKDEFLGIKQDVEREFPDYKIRILALNPTCISNELYLWAVPSEILR